MSDFEAALQDKLARNAELASQRAEAEQEMERFVAERQAEEERRAAEAAEAQRQRHSELVDVLSRSAQHLKEASPEDFVVRLGWTESGEEFIAKISTRLMEPSRSLFIELDRDDDEVLARWHSDVGNSLELWRLLEVPPQLLQTLVLQVADQELWRSSSGPPAFPKAG